MPAPRVALSSRTAHTTAAAGLVTGSRTAARRGFPTPLSSRLRASPEFTMTQKN